MKKHLSILLLLCLICLFAVSCSKNEAPQSDIQESSAINGSSDNDNKKTQDKPTMGDAADVVGYEVDVMGDEVDVDLTVLSSTMVYAEVYNIMTSPDDYMGKTIKMSGPYYASYYDETDKYYHYIVIEDAASCCQQGLEFLWNGEHLYPDDYPNEQTKIEVVGTFGSYEELGQIYYYLAVDNITIF